MISYFKKRSSQAAFTIVELLIVIVVIAILAAIIVVSYNGITQSARDSVRTTAFRGVVNGLEAYYIENGHYPNACGVLNTGCSIDNLQASLVPEFVSAIPNDPGPGITMRYVVGGDQTVWGKNYGLWIGYEKKPACKYLLGLNPPSGWWPSNPDCRL